MADLGFWNHAEEDPDRVVLVTPDGDKVSAGDLLGAANQVAHGLRAAGLERGDTVAVVMPNSRELLEVYLGALQVGLIYTPINHHLVGPEIAYIVQDSEAKAFFAHERFADVCTKAADEIGFPGDGRFAVGSVPGFVEFSSLKAGQPSGAPADRSAGVAMHYTSGTTGRPKGVTRGMPDGDPNEIGSLYAMFLMMFGVEQGAGNVHLTGSPLYHTAVLMWTSSSLHLGHKVVVMDNWTPEGMLELIDRHRVTTSHMVPTQFHRMLALPEDVRANYDVSSTRVMVHAAAPCPVEIKRRMLAWWGDSIHEYYAATEGGGTIVTPQEWLAKPGTVGKAWAGADIKILDDDGNDLPAGEVGTVYMLSAQANFEYKGDPDKTRESRRGDYFTVGDMGYLDEDGYLFLHDRKSDMIISGGVNIYPAEIESVFLTHPEVGDVAVFGIPHEDWGEEIKAVVEPAADVEPGDALTGDLMAFAREKLAKYKLPKSIDYTDEMPRDPSGKLYKRKLRDPYWEGRSRAI